jgi:hypothetical protein
MLGACNLAAPAAAGAGTNFAAQFKNGFNIEAGAALGDIQSFAARAVAALSFTMSPMPRIGGDRTLVPAS